MHILAILFFASVLGFAVMMIRNTLNGASERIGLALAGEYHAAPVRDVPVYIARRRPLAQRVRVTMPEHRLAA